jgi:cytochrome c oxidase subunit 2
MVVLTMTILLRSAVFVSAALVCAGSYAAAFHGAVTAATESRPHQPSSSSRTVRITAERFSFSPSEVKVPQGTTIEFHLKSDDTAHGFRIIGQSIDRTIPKRGRGETTVTFTPPGPGRYIFECSRMCGAGHSFMRGVIRVTAATEDAP